MDKFKCLGVKLNTSTVASYLGQLMLITYVKMYLGEPVS